MTLQKALAEAKSILRQSPQLIEKGTVDTEAEVLLLYVLKQSGLSRLDLYLRIQEEILPELVLRLRDLCQQRVGGKLLQHLTGVQTFLDHQYEVNSSVLIPRPETEVLVRYAMDELSRRPEISNGPIFGIEIGLGSGIISIELLKKFQKLKMIATELSPQAREVAIKNSNRILGLSALENQRLTILLPLTQMEVFEPIDRLEGRVESERACFIISNPPYLKQDASETDDEVRLNEPHIALYAPQEDPLYFYKKLAYESGRYLKSNGILFAELPHERAGSIIELFSKSKWKARIEKDLTGRDRVLIAELKNG